MAVVTNEELVRDYGISQDEVARLEAEADAYDSGEWPAGEVRHVGRPSTGAEETRPVTVRLTVSKLGAVDELAASRGVTRGAVLREAVDLLLEEAG